MTHDPKSIALAYIHDFVTGTPAGEAVATCWRVEEQHRRIKQVLCAELFYVLSMGRRSRYAVRE